MGWSTGYRSCKELLEQRKRSEKNERIEWTVLKTYYQFGTLWKLVEYKTAEKHVIFIALDLIRNFGKEDGWGYKDIEESMGPCYYNCPLEFLKLTPVENQDWRDKVIAYHAKRNTKLSLGQVVSLPNSTIKQLTVCSLRPLLGYSSTGRTYRFSKNQIEI